MGLLFLVAGALTVPSLVGRSDRDRRRLEDALAPVVPVVARPIAEPELVVARAAAADAELDQIAGDRRQQASRAGLDAAALGRADRIAARANPHRGERRSR